MRYAFVVLVLLQGISAGVAAAREERLVVRHRTGEIDQYAPDKQILQHATLDPKQNPTFEIHSGDQLRIVVEDANTVVFTYKLEKGTPTANANFTEASKFAEALAPLIDLLKPFIKKQAGGIRVLATNATANDKLLVSKGITPDFITQYITDVAELATRAADISSKTTRTLTSREEARAVRDEVAKWQFAALKQRLKKELQTIDAASIELLKSFSAVQHDPTVQFASLDKEALFMLAQTTGTPIGTPVTVPSQPATTNVNPADQQQTNGVPNTTLIPLQPGEIENSWSAIKQSQNYVMQLLGLVDTFVTRAAQLDLPIELTLEHNAQQDQPVTLTITPNDADLKTQLVTGDVKFTVNPHSYFTLKYDLGTAYSGVKTRHYQAKQDGTSFKIVRTDGGDEVSGFTGIAMLTMIPARHVDDPVSFGWQVGASPIKDKIGAFAGGVVRIFNLVSFGIGYTLQQSQRLAGDLAEGQPIASADELKTRNVFKSGPYVTVTISVGTKK